MNYILLLWALLLFHVRSWEDSRFEPESNLRLANLTGLHYYLYSWVGSYYNGTATFNFHHLMDSDGETPCARLRNKTATFSAESILAINKVHPDDEGENPVQVALRSAVKDFGYADDSFNLEDHRYLRWECLSIEQDRVRYEDGPHSPFFNLSLTDGTGPPYHITGSSNQTSQISSTGTKTIELDMDSCNSSTDTWWGISFQDPSSHYPKAIPVTEATMDVTFDNHTARFALNSWFYMTNRLGDGIRGKASVEFLGKIDPLHSDLLNGGREPSWTPTLGFANNSMNMRFGDKRSMAVRGVARGWLLLSPFFGLVLGGLV